MLGKSEFMLLKKYTRKVISLKGYLFRDLNRFTSVPPCNKYSINYPPTDCLQNHKMSNNNVNKLIGKLKKNFVR